MLVLFDHSAPAPLSSYFTGHTVTEARDRGWDRLSNGDLLAEAERAGFDVFLTADKNIRYQQNLKGRKIAILVLSTPQWPVERLHVEKIAAAVKSATPGFIKRVFTQIWPATNLKEGLAEDQFPTRHNTVEQ